jgi:ribonucleoside-diphosphate reductase alpha chain
MGLHDLLIKVGVAYDSEEGRQLASTLQQFINDTASEYSSALAKERGNFPAWEGSVFATVGLPRRNATTTTIAPTGTISQINRSSSGLEPWFAFGMMRNVDGDVCLVIPPIVEWVAKKYGFWSPEIIDKIVAEQGSVQNIPEVPDKVKKFMKTAMEISPTDHVLMQGILQRDVENSISKTNNLPSNATVDDIQYIYKLAHEVGCKGCTVYRDASRDSQVLYTGGTETIDKDKHELERGEILAAPEAAPGCCIQILTGCGKMYLNVSWDKDGNIIQTFISTGSKGGCIIFTEATSRLISIGLRGGIPLEKIVDQLAGLNPCSSYTNRRTAGKKVSPGSSCPSAIGLMLIDIQKKI